MSRRSRVRRAAGNADRPVAESTPPRPSLWLLDANTWLVMILAILVATVQWWLVRDLRQLPSPIFGGDWTYQEACIRSILVNSNPLASPTSGDALPGYLPLYGNLVAALVRWSGLDVERAMLLMSIINHVASTVIVFLVIARHFGRRTALVVACLWQWASVGLTVRYTEFTAQVLVPLYFDALLLVLSDPRIRNALYLGLVVAVLGYAHAVVFIGGIAIAVAALAIRTFSRARINGWRAELGAGLLPLGVLAACCLLALGYWYRPLFVFHGHTSPHYSEWNGGEAVQTLGQRLSFALRLLKRSLLDVSNGATTTLTILSVAGLTVLVAGGGWRRYRAVTLVCLLTFSWTFHFLLTMPLIHAHFVPEYARRMLWGFASLLTAAVAVRLLVDRVSAGKAWALSGATIVALCAGGIVVQARSLASEPSMVSARAPLPASLLGLQSWAYAHAPADAVVLSTNELSFAWCVLTGRKAFVSRRAQNDPFLDLDERNRDAAQMLYGRDEAKRSELLRRWNISYVLWTSEWANSEYVFLPGGQVGMKDPLFYFANPRYDEELQSDSVIVEPVRAWVDPYLRGPAYPQFDLGLISWKNYRALDRPWSARLDAYLERVWAYPDSGQATAVLYRVRDPAR